MLPVEIVYLAENNTVFHVCLKVKPGTTLLQAVKRSGFHHDHEDTTDLTYAVFGQIKSAEYQLLAGDRIEVLRPLKIDPMTNRRLRAQKSIDSSMA